MKNLIIRFLNWIAPKVGMYLVANELPKFEVRSAKIETIMTKMHIEDSVLSDEGIKEHALRNMAKEIGLELLESGMAKQEILEIPYNPLFGRENSQKVLTLTVKVLPYERA